MGSNQERVEVMQVVTSTQEKGSHIFNTEIHEKKNTSRVLYFDILNILACIAVVSLHHNGIVHTYSDSWTWKTALMVEVGAYWCVPVFLMLTGATLMTYRKKYDTKTFFKKRFWRTVVPFFAWSAIVLVWKLKTNQFAFETGDVKEVINAMLNYKMENVYWYFPFLFSVYLMMPLLSWLTEEKCRHTLKYLIVTMFVLQSTIVPITKLIGISRNSNYAISMNSYFIFVLLGYYLSTCELYRTQRYIIYVNGVLGAVIRYVAIYLLSTRDGAKNTLFFNYGYFPSVMLAVAVFVWVKQVDWKKCLSFVHVSQKRIGQIASCSLGVYLIHRIVMYYELDFLAGWEITNRSPLWRTVGIIVTYSISLGIVALLKKLPIIRKLLP